MNTDYPRPSQEDMEASRYAPMLWLWPMAVHAGVVRAGTQPEDIFSLFRSTGLRAGSPKYEALAGMFYAAVWYSYVTRRMRWPKYQWEADSGAAWGPADAMTERSRIAQDALDIRDVLRLHADALYAAESKLRVAFAASENERKDTSAATDARIAEGDEVRKLIEVAARQIKLPGSNRHPTGSRSAVAIAIAEHLAKTGINRSIKYIQHELSIRFKGDSAWNARHE